MYSLFSFFIAGDKWKKVKYLMKKWKKKLFVLIKTQVFFYANKQQLN